VRGAICVALLVCGACSSRPAEESPYAGTWVVNVEARPFLVLTLERDGDRFAGTLTRPRMMTTDGRSVSRIGQDLHTDRVSAGQPPNGALRLVATPDGEGEMMEFDLKVNASGDGSLALAGAPFPPFPVVRHMGATPAQVWTGWDATRTYLVDEPYVAPNAEMAAIYQADQAPRQSAKDFQAHAAQIEKDDAVRREKTRALLEKGELRAKEDFRLAALVFQHGAEPRDYLFAHTLALVALAKGDRSASWIASASLDRYLQSIDRPQIFGTAFTFQGTSREPFDRETLDAGRRRQPALPDDRRSHRQGDEAAGP
jgi:hypothetical protein